MVTIPFNPDIGISENDFLDFLRFVNMEITVNLTLSSPIFSDSVQNFLTDLRSKVGFRLDFNASYDEMSNSYKYNVTVHGTRTSKDYITERLSSILSRSFCKIGKY